MRAPTSNLRSTQMAVQDRVNAVREKLSKVLPAQDSHSYTEVTALAVHDDEDDYESDEDEDMEAPKRRRRAPPTEKTGGSCCRWTTCAVIALLLLAALGGFAYWYIENTIDELAFEINPTAFKNKTSPQARAWTWMKSAKAKNGREANIERYAIAALYHATNMSEDPEMETWLNDGPVCEWAKQQKFNIECIDDIITTIDFTNAMINGPIVPELGLLTTLKHLTLVTNQFTGTIPATIGRLTNLRTLNLNGAFVKDSARPIPADIHKLIDAKIVDLGSNGLTGTVPADLLTHMSDLRLFSLADNALAGSFPSGDFGRLTDLEELNFSGNKFGGSIPSSYSTLPSLKKLDVSQNQVDGDWTGLPSTIETLNLAGISLKGSLPDPIRDLPNLLELDISNNALTGELTPLPPDLQHLDASNNYFHGSLPQELPDSLVLLYLDNNKWEGTIPPDFGDLIDLKVLTLDHTNVEGYIPADFPEDVTDIDIRATNIGGPIAPELCRENVEIVLDCDVPLGCDGLSCCVFQDLQGNPVDCPSRPPIPPPQETDDDVEDYDDEEDDEDEEDDDEYDEDDEDDDEYDEDDDDEDDD